MTLSVRPDRSSADPRYSRSSRSVSAGCRRHIVGGLAGRHTGLAADAKRRVVKHPDRLRRHLPSAARRWPTASVGTAAAAVAKPAPLRKSLRSTSVMARPLFGRVRCIFLPSPICLSSMAPAPTTRPPTTPTVAAAPALIPWPFAASTCGKAVGGVRVLTVDSACSGLRNAVSFSVQPKQGCPVPTGQEPKPTSPKPIAGQLA